jgi:hypothetical protein
MELNPLINTPDASFFGTAALQSCVDNPACLQCIDEAKDQFDPACTPVVPLGLLAGSMIYSQVFHFDAPGIANNFQRRLSSENTCGGCHGANALDPAVPFGPAGLNLVPPYPVAFTSVPESFYHVDARTPAGFPVRLSRFLAGTDSVVPLAPGAGVPVTTPIPDRVTFSANLGTKKFADLRRRGSVLAAQRIPGNCEHGGGAIMSGLVAEPATLVVNPFLIQQQSLKLVH